MSWEVVVFYICKSYLVKSIVNTWVGLSCNLCNLLAPSLIAVQDQSWYQ